MSASAESPRMCGLIAEAYPRDAAKFAARAAGVSHRTAEAWTTGRRSPAADVLLRMAARCDRMAAALQRNLDARTAAKTADPRPVGSVAGIGDGGDVANEKG